MLGWGIVLIWREGYVAQMSLGTPPHSGTSGEMDLYRANCFILKKVKEMESKCE